MLEATIVSPRGSLYLAAEATPYDVQELRAHVQALCTESPSEVHLGLHIGPQTRARVGELVTALAEQLRREGVRVSIDDASVATRAPARNARTSRRTRVRA